MAESADVLKKKLQSRISSEIEFVSLSYSSDDIDAVIQVSQGGIEAGGGECAHCAEGVRGAKAVAEVVQAGDGGAEEAVGRERRKESHARGATPICGTPRCPAE